MIGDVDKRIARALAGVRQAFRSVIAAADSSGAIQMVQVQGLAGETQPDLEVFQHYGFTSALPDGTMAVVVPIGGKSSHGIVVATEHGTYRLAGLKPGEIAIYTDEGDSIVLARGRVINVSTDTLNISAKTAVNIDSPEVNLTKKLNVAEQITGQGGMAVSGGDGVEIDGSMNVSGDVTAGNKSLVHHKHPETGSVTDEPI